MQTKNPTTTSLGKILEEYYVVGDRNHHIYYIIILFTFASVCNIFFIFFLCIADLE